MFYNPYQSTIMKKSFAILAIFFLSAFAFAQSAYFKITGKVIDGATSNALQAASVFAQSTTIGTATDANGNFTLTLPNGGYDLVITFTGYETITRRITTADGDDKNIVIIIRPKVNSMEDVVVKASNEVKDGWEKYGSFFLENFLGKTTNSKLCSITNKDVLKFYFSKKRNRLKVLANTPLEIENLALGYKLKYSLDSFTHEYTTQASTYTGYPLFEEMQQVSAEQKATWQANRFKAYKGSMLHFMRSVYSRSLKEEGFEIQFVAKISDRETAVKLPDFYGALNYNKEDSTQMVYIIPNQPVIAVLYNKEEPEAGYTLLNEDEPKKYEQSIITIASNESIAIEQNGYYFDQNDITITGYWAWDKIADMVPYEYRPD